MDPRHITHDEIKKLAYGIPGISPAERETAKALLTRLVDAHDGAVWRRDLHLELVKLRSTFVITETAQKSIEAAVFNS